MKNKSISIHLNSKNPNSFKEFIKSLADSVSNINNIEVLVHIDHGDVQMKNLIKELNLVYNNLIVVVETNLIKSFSDAWKPLNILLEKTSRTVLLISCMSDEIRFRTTNWDLILYKYSSTYKDDIYRVRCSKYKDEEYNDLWECGYKPDAYSFYSKKWLDIVGEWNPCIGPDTYQECISFYLNKYGAKYNRNIIDNIIMLDGQDVSSNINIKTRLKRSRIYYKAFFILMSYKIQKRARSSAHKIAMQIDSKEANLINIGFPNYFEHTIKNFIRRFNFFKHRGSSEHPINSPIRNILFLVWCYVSIFDSIIIKTIYFIYKIDILKKFIKNKEQYEKFEKILNREK